MKNIISLILILFISCNNVHERDRHEGNFTKSDSLKTKLIGQWGSLGENIPVWEIRLDSIYYFQELKAYSYQILDNDFIIDRPYSKGVLKNISVIGDTMVFNDEQGLIVKGYRFKNSIK